MAAVIEKNRKYYTFDMLKSLGYSQYMISKLVKNKILLKLNKSTYENAGFTGEDSDFYCAYAYAPKGVICLMSAAVYYNLSNYRPDSIDVAIPRKSKVSTLPEWPEIKLHYFTENRFQKGIATINNDGNIFRIYDMEKTVCDVVFYRELVGIEETREIIKNYIERPERDLNKLVRYSEELKCERILKNYLEVLV